MILYFSIFHCGQCSLGVAQHVHETLFKHSTYSKKNTCIESGQNIVNNSTLGCTPINRSEHKRAELDALTTFTNRFGMTNRLSFCTSSVWELHPFSKIIIASSECLEIFLVSIIFFVLNVTNIGIPQKCKRSVTGFLLQEKV